MNRIDNNIVQIVAKGDEKAFETEFKKLVDLVSRNGKKIAYDIIKPSEIIVPPSDLTIEEAKEIFKEDGLIPD